MEIKILATESMGVRSMATFIHTEGLNIIIDPSCALCPKRYGLPPHPIEVKEEERRLNLINEHLSLADIVIISHFHYDHFTLKNTPLYKDKMLFIKDPYNYSHKGLEKRAERFLKALPEIKRIEIADGKRYKIGNSEIIFSPPLCHGTVNSKVYVIATCIKSQGITFLHTSDIQGINTENQLNFIKQCLPDITFLDGFPLYLLGIYYNHTEFKHSSTLLSEAKNYTSTLIIDHHIARIDTFKELLQNNLTFVTGAEFMHEEEKFLESQRKKLYSM